MSKYYTREDKDNALRSKADIYYNVAQFLPKIRPVFYAFDGKCINCRFQAALHDATDEFIEVKKNYNGTEYVLTHYYCGNFYTLAKLSIAKMEDGKRINADALMDSAREYRENYLKKHNELMKDLQDIDLIIGQLDYYKDKIKSIVDGLPWEVRDIYNLRNICY